MTDFRKDRIRVDGELRWAVISEDDVYRYELGRQWDPGLPVAVWFGLNPSTADATVDDPTIRRVRGFTKREGLGGFVMLNLCALRSTAPEALLRCGDPYGPMNRDTFDHWLNTPDVGIVVAAWGSFLQIGDKRLFKLPRHIEPLVYSRHEIKCLGTTKGGEPRHPLYVKADAPFIPWSP